MTFRIAYKVHEAAALLSVSRSFLYREIAAGRLRAVKCGRSTRIIYSDLIRYVETWSAYLPAQANGALALNPCPERRKS